MTNQPAWWNVARVEIDEIMFGFADALKNQTDKVW